MQTAMSTSARTAFPGSRAGLARSSRGSLRAARYVVRAAEQSPKEASVQSEADDQAVSFSFESSPPAAPAAATPAAAPAQPFSLLGVQQEAINGRAAMLGFMVAIATELTTQQSVWSQVAGKYVDRSLVEKPLGASVLTFAFVVVVTSLASFAPTVYKGENPSSRSFGPFTPAAELSNGRAAMIGFLALLAVEFFRGNVALF